MMLAFEFFGFFKHDLFSVSCSLFFLKGVENGRMEFGDPHGTFSVSIGVLL